MTIPRWVSKHPLIAALAPACLVLPVLTGCPDSPDDTPSTSPTPVEQTAPHIQVTPDYLDFGTVLRYTTRSLPLEIANVGDAELYIGAIDIEQEGEPFSWTEQPLPMALPPGLSITIQVNFTPDAEQGYWGNLRIENNDEDRAIVEVPLVGEGTRGTDEDGDDVTVEEGDCDDHDPTVYPGADEICDGVDNDCDGTIDEGFDSDGDGVTTCDEPPDCDDSDPSTYPGAEELCDGVDNDCDGTIDEGFDGDGDGTSDCTDDDGDGYSEQDGDCDDTDPAVHPDASESCNGIDDDCNGTIDDGLPTSPYYPDRDGDGFGDPSGEVDACQPPADHVTDATDCNDEYASIHPGAEEVCNGVDDNCDGAIDENVQTTYYADQDGDGYGADTSTVDACAPPDGFAPSSSDCNDQDPTVHPDADETCNGVDDDCDGSIDENLPIATYSQDADGDGYGNPANQQDHCAPPDGFVLDDSDCDDSRNDVHPGATEVCNGIDDDCDGSIDENVTTDYFPDSDGDGYGNQDADPTPACSAPDGYVSNATDCDDTLSDVHPGATEQCNDRDDDCDGEVDESLTTTDYFLDADADGWGSDTNTTSGCTRPPGYVSTGGDCDDTNPAVHPEATEVCNGIDDDCDGSIDENVTTDYFPDIDGDGYGAAGATPTPACTAPADLVPDDSDCNDNDPAVHPGATELCNGIDDNCNGTVDEGFGDCNDSDDDGDGYSENQWDCDDTDAATFPILVDASYNGGAEDGSPDRPFNTIQEGIVAARPDCPVVLVAPGTYQEHIDFLGKTITVRSTDGPEITIVDGTLSGTVVTFQNGETRDTLLEGLTITRGSASRGGGITIQNASPTIRACVLTDNHTTRGGAGIYVESGTPDITGNTFSENEGATNWDSEAGGAILLRDAPATISGNTFRRNTHISGGAIGLFQDSDATIDNNVFEENQADYPDGGATGGAIYVFGSSPTIVGNTFTQNHSSQVGGAIYLNGVDYSSGEPACSSPEGTHVRLENNTFTANTAGTLDPSSTSGKGGAIYATCVEAELVGNDFDDNQAGVYGGAAYFRFHSWISLTGNTFDANAAINETNLGAGGALYLATTTATLTANRFTSNTSGFHGGALFLTEAVDLTFLENVVTDNSAQSKGGGLYANNSFVEIDASTFESNTAENAGGIGLIDSDGTVTHNLILENQATDEAGGIWVTNIDTTAAPVISNNIIQGNTVTAGRGGGLCLNDEMVGDSGTMAAHGSVINNVIADNSATEYGAGIYVGKNASATVMNNIVYWNTGSQGIYVFPTTSSDLVVSYNDAVLNSQNYGGGPTGGFDSTNLSVDPRFVAYSHDGNPANDDFHLDPSSPVKDKGAPGSTYQDEDGSRNDMGAYGGPDGNW